MTFLIAYLLYNDAIQTVLTLVGTFGQQELHIVQSQLMIAILMVQFVGFFGAIGFNWLASKTSAKHAGGGDAGGVDRSLDYIYVAVRTTAEFSSWWASAALIMGGSQALSRSFVCAARAEGQRGGVFQHL